MNKILSSLTKLIIAVLLLWVFPHFSVAVSAPDQVILELVNADSPDPVVAGNLLTYTLSVTNTGEESASGVVLSDVLPAGVTFNEASPGCNPVAGVVSCELGSLDPDVLIVVTITVEVDPAARGSLTNVASVTSNETGPGEPINEVTTINAIAALTISKDDGVSQVTAGDGVARTYAIQVTNAGPSDASGVAVTDTWPAGFNRGTVNYPPGVTCDTTTSPRDFTCDLGDIPVGGQRTITVGYTVPADTGAGLQTNTVQASAVEGSTPVTDDDINVVLTLSNLRMTKSDGVTELVAGDSEAQAYVITLTNDGPSRATGVTVTDTWPSVFTRGTVTTSRGSCSNTTPGFTCDVGTMQVGDEVTIRAPYTVPPGTTAGPYTNTAEATDEDGAPPATASDDTNVITRADVRLLSKTDSPDPVISGEILTYNLSITNAGPSHAAEVVLTDHLPAGTEYEDALSTAACSGVGSTVTCPLGVMAAGVTRNLTIKVLVTATTAGSITNVANVTATTTDPNPDNNEKQQSTTVQIDISVPVVSWILPVTNLEDYLVICRPDCPTVRLEVSASDDLGVQRVHFYRWDHVIEEWIAIGDDTIDPYTWEFDTSTLPFGINQIYAQAFDGSDKPSARQRIFLDKPSEIFMPLIRR